MTEKEVLASEEFTEAVRILREQSLKPFQSLEVSFPRNRWNMNAIRTYLRHLVLCLPEGLDYFMDARCDDENEYLIFENKPIMAEIASA
ncbi:MAG: hypothetical protein WA637_18700 [Terriglobales bacterium]